MRQSPVGQIPSAGCWYRNKEGLNNIHDVFNGCKYAGGRHVCPNIAGIKTQEV